MAVSDESPSAGTEHHSGHGALPSREGAQSRAATQGLEVQGLGGGRILESQSQPLVVWQWAWEPWGLLGKSQGGRTG